MPQPLKARLMYLRLRINNFLQHFALRDFIFIPLFFSSFIVFKTYGNFFPLLEHFNSRPVSLATSEGIDIANRISVFYKGFFLFAVLTFGFTSIVAFLRNFFSISEIKILNGLSLAGFCLMIFQLYGANLMPDFHLIFSLQLICLSGVPVRFGLRQFQNPLKQELHFTSSAILSVSVYFLLWQLSQLFNLKCPTVPYAVLIIGVVFYNFILRREGDIRQYKPLIYIPLLYFISMEAAFVFNQHDIHLRPEIPFFIGTIYIIFLIYNAGRKNRINQPEISFDEISKKWFPFLIAGLCCLMYYHPVIETDIDLFEDANHILPLQQLALFNKIPFIHTFSSHALSDFFFGGLYSALNGYNPMGVFIYGPLLNIIILLLAYHLVLKISGDAYLALWIALFYPYTDYILPAYFSMIPLVVLAFINVVRKTTVKNYILFFTSIAFIILWRVDLGYAILAASVCILIFLLFTDEFIRDKRSNMLRALAWITGLGCIIFLLFFIVYGRVILTSLNDVIAYIASAQSYGIKTLADITDQKYFFLYFILPVAVFCIAGYSFYYFRKKKD